MKIILYLILLLTPFSGAFAQWEYSNEGKPVDCTTDGDPYKKMCGNSHEQWLLGVDTWREFHHYGHITNNYISSGIRGKKRNNYLIFGPYINVYEIGSLFVTVKLKITHFERLNYRSNRYNPEESIAYIDLVSNKGRNTLAHKQIYVDDLPLKTTYRTEKGYKQGLPKLSFNSNAIYPTEREVSIPPELFGTATHYFIPDNPVYIEWTVREYRLKKSKYIEIYFNVPITKPTKGIEVRIRELAPYMNLEWHGTQIIYIY